MAGKNDNHPAISAAANSFLNIPVSKLKGVGPKRAELFRKKGINTVLDLFYFIPKGYEDRSKALPFDHLVNGKPAFVKGKVVWSGEEKLFRARKNLYKILINGNGRNLELVWFNVNKNYFSSVSTPGLELSAYGTVKINGGKIQIYHPDISAAADEDEESSFLPVYSSIEGLSNRILRSITRYAVDRFLDLLIDPIPEYVVERYNLPSLRETVNQLHFPDKETDLDSFYRSDTVFHKRILFDRFFNLMIRISHDSEQRKNTKVSPLQLPGNIFEQINDFFPFDLTKDQLKSIREIHRDLTGGNPMNRLIMGDVGTGKTLVAAAAAYMVTKNGFQTAIMAPTQLLAEQHMDYFSSLPQEMGFRPVLLTGSLNKSAKNKIYSSVSKGHFNIIIGTHALIQNKLSFKNLGLAVIDEQHRFGVRQRSTIVEKGKSTHVLSMSATPIPRTIALTLFWDRDLSIISQYPGNHVSIDTKLVKRSNKRWIFDTMNETLSKGRQIYVICPLIDESESLELRSVIEMTKSLRKIVNPLYKIDYIHGQLEPAEKENRLTGFRKGRINILVATTVIEVGIHVPNASLMIIEHPERLGLAQLHQLRGRIGRDGQGGRCILVYPDKPDENTLKRLRIMTECDNGFEIAKKDMEFRGHGEITGIRQSGFSEFEIMNILENHSLFRKAANAAINIFRTDRSLSLSEHRSIRSILEMHSVITT